MRRADSPCDVDPCRTGLECEQLESTSAYYCQVKIIYFSLLLINILLLETDITVKTRDMIYREKNYLATALALLYQKCSY